MVRKNGELPMNKVKSRSTMHGPTKARRTPSPKNVPRKTSREKVFLTIAKKKYSVPQEVVARLEAQLEPHWNRTIGRWKEGMPLEVFFEDEHGQCSQGAINLRGLRYRENPLPSPKRGETPTTRKSPE